jgi:hypothetical protein
LQFSVSGLTRPVESAKVRLYVTNASNQDSALYLVGNTYKDTATPWTELGLNWNNAPAIGATPLSSASTTPANSWVEFDVTAALNGNGTYSFGIRTPATNDVRYSSKEAASNRPELVIQQADPPALDNFVPTKGQVGIEVTISGSGFAGATGVTFGGVAASSFTVDSDTQIRAIVPAGAAQGKISVTTAAGTTTSVTEFELTPLPPTVGGFAPARGKAGTQVTISGSGFAGVTGVTFGGVAASSFTVDSDTQIRAIVPASAVTGSIGVANSAGTASSAASFEVLPATAPSQRTYVPLATRDGTAASLSSARASAKALYSPLVGDWRSVGSPRTFICTFDLT